MLATIQTTPESPRAQNNVGAYYFKQGDYQKALEHFQLALKNNSRFLDAYQNLGVTYLKIGKKEEAREIIEAGLQINPNSKILQSLLRETQ